MVKGLDLTLQWRVIRFGTMKARYDAEPSTITEPINAEDAVVLPTYITPNTELMKPRAKVAFQEV
jgi:hypothetical protein